jgi:hypothetical protein
MSLYSLFKTDENIEKAGLLIEYGTNSKGLPIAIRIARAGGSNSAYLKLLDASLKPYRRQLQNDLMDNPTVEKVLRTVYAKTIVLGWENVEDEKGEALPFNVDNCVKLFTDLPDLFADIRVQAEKSALFRAEIMANDAKN